MHPLLEPYVRVADLIVGTFGSDCDVILHDLTQPRRSVVYVANDSVTHRETGSGFRHLVRELLKKPENADGMVLNYYFDDKGKRIRSSFLLIRDEEKKLIGALCINVDTTRTTQALALLESMLPGYKEVKPAPRTPESANVNDIVNEFIDRMIDEIPPGKLSREKRLELISFMHSRGVFLMKGAVDYVSSRLGIAKVTIYSDLDSIKNQKVIE